MPLRSSSVRFEVKAEGKSVPVGEPMPRAEIRTVDPDYFRAAGISLVKGRPFAATDERGAGKVVIINQTFANKFYPNEDPVGKRIAWTGDVLRFTPFSGEWRTIVGVSANTQDWRTRCEATASCLHAVRAGSGDLRRLGDTCR
jgi:hypothetical protein